MFSGFAGSQRTGTARQYCLLRITLSSDAGQENGQGLCVTATAALAQDPHSVCGIDSAAAKTGFKLMKLIFERKRPPASPTDGLCR
jgi:hypothetical protein